MLLCILPALAHADITTGLVGWWKFDESSGNAVDSSGQGNTGTPSGATIVTSGCRKGNCRGFNGSNNNITVVDNDVLDVQISDFTVAVWAYKNGNSLCCSGDTYQPFVGKGVAVFTYTYLLSGKDDGTIYFAAFDGNTYNPSVQSLQAYFNAGAWHHYVGVYKQLDNATALKLYVDGVLVNTASRGGYTTASNYASSLWMGEWPNLSGGGRGHLNGLLDDVRVYNRALTAGDVTELYNYGSTPVGRIRINGRAHIVGFHVKRAP